MVRTCNRQGPRSVGEPSQPVNRLAPVKPAATSSASTASDSALLARLPDPDPPAQGAGVVVRRRRSGHLLHPGVKPAARTRRQGLGAGPIGQRLRAACPDRRVAPTGMPISTVQKSAASAMPRTIAVSVTPGWRTLWSASRSVPVGPAAAASRHPATVRPVGDRGGRNADQQAQQEGTDQSPHRGSHAARYPRGRSSFRPTGSLAGRTS